MSNEYEYQFNTMNIWEQIIKQNAFSFLFQVIFGSIHCIIIVDTVKTANQSIHTIRIPNIFLFRRSFYTILTDTGKWEIEPIGPFLGMICFGTTHKICKKQKNLDFDQ